MCSTGRSPSRCRAHARQSLGPGGFAYCPPDAHIEARATVPRRLNVFEKRYATRPGCPVPEPLCGHERDVEGTAVHG